MTEGYVYCRKTDKWYSKRENPALWKDFEETKAKFQSELSMGCLVVPAIPVEEVAKPEGYQEPFQISLIPEDPCSS